MITIAVANHKGGTGKTTSVRNLGPVLAGDHGLRVLMVDLDPQSSLTGACGLADVIFNLGAGLDLAPADIYLSVSELGLTSRMGREKE